MTANRMQPRGAQTPLIETLENDAAALAVLVRLAEYGAECCQKFHARIGTPGERQADYPAAVTVARMFDNGAGGYEADAVLAWARQRLAEAETTLAALDGSGAPFAPSSGFAYLIEQIEAVRASHDLGTRSSALLDGAAAVLGTWNGGGR